MVPQVPLSLSKGEGPGVRVSTISHSLPKGEGDNPAPRAEAWPPVSWHPMLDDKLPDPEESGPGDAPAENATPEPPALTPEQTAALLDHIARLDKENSDLKDASLRAMAEAQNVQRRLRQQMENEKKYAAEPLARELVPVLDNLNRTLDAVEKGASLETLVEGVRAVEKQIQKALSQAGVQRVASVGHPFNPEQHEALVVLETEEHPEDTVVDEIESGYVMHDRLIRPARVRVSKRP